MVKINLELEAKNKYELTLDLEHIAELIMSGYTSGISPNWKLEGEEDEFSRDELIQAQKDYCDEHEVPMFVPSNGKCFYCLQDCVTPKWVVEHITGCPKCHHTFCD